MIDSSARQLSANPPTMVFPARPVSPSLGIPRLSIPKLRVGSAARALDRYLRRRDSRLASALLLISDISGQHYSNSRAKRVLDLLIAVPALLFSIVPIVAILALNRLLYPRHPALFFQERVGHGGTMRVLKVRSMTQPNAITPSRQSAPMVTRFGGPIRRFYLDELPQLLQVLRGQLSVVGIRVLPVQVYEGLSDAWSEERFCTWQQAYASTSLGLTGVHQIWRRDGKEDEKRFRRDAFYARKASLGFDLYLIWRTFIRVAR